MNSMYREEVVAKILPFQVIVLRPRSDDWKTSLALINGHTGTLSQGVILIRVFSRVLGSAVLEVK